MDVFHGSGYIGIDLGSCDQLTWARGVRGI